MAFQNQLPVTPSSTVNVTANAPYLRYVQPNGRKLLQAVEQTVDRKAALLGNNVKLEKLCESFWKVGMLWPKAHYKLQA
jgi:hypothetical protein